MPHAVSNVPAVQLVISQQPIAQLVGSHAAPPLALPVPLAVPLAAPPSRPLPPPPSSSSPPSGTMRKSLLRKAGHPARLATTTIVEHRAKEPPLGEVMSFPRDG
jgi:hypothetical protein